jgi:hypothetical protein
VEGVILIHRDAVEGLRDEGDIDKALQTALELEHATIPTYLYAYYSLVPTLNRSVSNLIRSVVMDEMGHMALVCNLMNAIGAEPSLDQPGFVPLYPGPLPGSVQSGLQVRLAPFSIELVHDVFMEIEEPEDPLAFPDLQLDEDAEMTIGEFYAEIAGQLQVRGPGVFTGDPNRQIGPGASGLSNVMAVTDLETALQAIHTIVEQGEGTTLSPEVDPTDPTVDPAHYYKFAMIFHGRRLIHNPDAGPESPPSEQYIYGGDPIPIDPAGILPLPTNPRAEEFPAGSEARALADQFNIAYTSMLQTLHRAANGEPTLVSQATASMRNELRPAALQLVGIQLDNGLRAAPTFEFADRSAT